MKNYTDIISQPNRPKIGVVVSSGGIKSFAAVELFDFLAKANIPIDLLVGSSGGSVICSYKAFGYTVDEMREFIYRLVTPDMFKMNYKGVAAFLNIPFIPYRKDRGILSNNVFIQSLIDAFGKDTNIEDLSIPFISHTTNIDTGEGVDLSTGNLVKSVYASAALLPFFPPVNINGQWLSDGGFSCPVPTLQAVTAGMDIIIVIDVQPKTSYISRLNRSQTYLQTFDSFFMMALSNTTSFQNLLAVNTHHHEIIFISIPFEEPIEMWETKKIKTVFDKGKEAVEKVQDHILKAISLFERTN